MSQVDSFRAYANNPGQGQIRDYITFLGKARGSAPTNPPAQIQDLIVFQGTALGSRPGGTPFDGIDGTGATDVTALLNAVWANAPQGSVLDVPAGLTYRHEQPMVMSALKDLTINFNGTTFLHEIRLAVHTTSGNGQITSAGLFTTDMQGQPISGTGIPDGTICRPLGFVDSSHMNISQNATATGDITLHMAPLGRENCHWDLRGTSGITFNQPIITGQNTGGGYTAALEAQHGFNLVGCDTILINKPTISAIYGDFLYMTDYGPPLLNACSNIRMTGGTLFNNGRQAISTVCLKPGSNGRGAEIDHNTFTNMPRAVLDFEITSVRQTVDTFNFHHNTVNFHQLNFISTGANPTPGVLKNVTIADNTAASFGQIYLHSGFGGLRGSNFAFVRNIQTGTYHAGNTPGALIDIWNVDGVDVGGGTANVNANTTPLSSSTAMYEVIASNCTSRIIAGNVLTPTSNSNQSLAYIRSYCLSAPIPATSGTAMTVKDPGIANGVTLPATPFTFDIRSATAPSHVEHCTCTNTGAGGTHWVITRGTAYSGGIQVGDPILLT